MKEKYLKKKINTDYNCLRVEGKWTGIKVINTVHSKHYFDNHQR